MTTNYRYKGQLELDKWGEQQRRRQEAEEQRRREREEAQRREREEQRKREEEAKQQKLYKEALNYLTEEEQRLVRDEVVEELRGVSRSREFYDQRLQKATIERAIKKHRKEQKKEQRKRRRRATVKSWITGR